jgi:hypothetical protein
LSDIVALLKIRIYVSKSWRLRLAKLSYMESHMTQQNIYLFIASRYIYLPMEVDVLEDLFLISISPPSAGGGAGSLRV